jgi:hypothetical protein
MKCENINQQLLSTIGLVGNHERNGAYSLLKDIHAQTTVGLQSTRKIGHWLLYAIGPSRTLVS